MPEPSRVEYETIGLDYRRARGLVISLATFQETKVALCMRQSTFDDLAAQIAKAKAD
jgi:hypothetical protein